jgi:CDP-glucose 4,6-dehydratase
LLLAQRLASGQHDSEGSWNFGPSAESVHSVSRLADDVVAAWGDGARWYHEPVDQPHESSMLTLDATKARLRLGWRPRLGYAEGVRWTVDWYKASGRGENMEAFTLAQIDGYLELPP